MSDNCLLDEFQRMRRYTYPENLVLRKSFCNPGLDNWNLFRGLVSVLLFSLNITKIT